MLRRFLLSQVVLVVAASTDESCVGDTCDVEELDSDDMSQLQLLARTDSPVAKLASPDEGPSEKEKDCADKFTDATNKVMICMGQSKLRDPALLDYIEDYHSLSVDEFQELWERIAENEAIEIIKDECDPIHDLHFDHERWGGIQFAAQKAVKRIVSLWVEVLEDPRTDLHIDENMGSDKLASIFAENLDVFGEICESDSDDMEEVKESCQHHLNLAAFTHAIVGSDGVDACSAAHESLLQEHVQRRHKRSHKRARMVQVLHSKDNKLAHYFQAHLRLGGSEKHMDYLIAAAALEGLTRRQRHLLLQIDGSSPNPELQQNCDTWASQRTDFKLDESLKDNVLLNSKVYRRYMDCLCSRDEPNVLCQAELLRDSNDLTNDLEQRQRHLLTESNEQSHQLATSDEQSFSDEDVHSHELSIASSTTNSTAPPVGIGPCLLSDAFSCEVCLSHACVPFGSRPSKKGRKNKADEDSPWVVIKNALTAKATQFKISCTACMSLHPGEQLSFEIEMYAATDFANMDTMFTQTKIGVDAKTCIGPGSPLRVIFDTLGITACKSNLKAEYTPFLGDFNIQGSIPGPVAGTFFEAEFDTAIHDPPEAVTKHCTTPQSCSNQWHWTTINHCFWFGCIPFPHYTYGWHCTGGYDAACYNRYKNMAGPQTLTGAVTIPLEITQDAKWKFEIVKVSGPHSSPKWKVELFQMPFDKVIQAIKELWDNHIGPAMQDALNGAGEAVEAVGEWTVGAANDAGEWTVGAAKDVGKWTEGAASTIGNGIASGASDAGHAVGHVFGGRRRRRFF